MFAALGPISFQVIASPTKIEVSKKYRWEYIYVIGAPPIAQWILDQERHIELCIYLHQLWCNPQSALESIEQLADLHEPQALVFGSGLNVGNFVIAEIRDKQIWRADNGNLIATELTISLTEYPNATAASTNYPQDTSIGNPPGLTTSQTASPGSTLVVSPSTAAPPGIPPQNPYTSIPLSTIAREG